MHVVAVIFLVIVLSIGVVIFCCAALDSSSSKDQQRTQIITAGMIGFVCFLMAAWLVRSLLISPIVARETVVEASKVVNSDGTYLQMINYTDQYGKPHLIDLRTIFSGILPEKTKVKIVEFQLFGYCGISYTGTEVCQPKYFLSQ